jgi:hypothetical protein
MERDDPWYAARFMRCTKRDAAATRSLVRFWALCVHLWQSHSVASSPYVKHTRWERSEIRSLRLTLQTQTVVCSISHTACARRTLLECPVEWRTVTNSSKRVRWWTSGHAWREVTVDGVVYSEARTRTDEGSAGTIIVSTITVVHRPSVHLLGVYSGSIGRDVSRLARNARIWARKKPTVTRDGHLVGELQYITRQAEAMCPRAGGTLVLCGGRGSWRSK